MDKTAQSSMAKRTSVRAMILAALVAFSSTGEAFAQAAALTITKSFSPSSVAVGGIFSINPGAETFSSTSNVLAPGQSCSITLLVRPTAVGPHLNTTSQVTGTGVPPGGPATATLNGAAPAIPVLGPWPLAALAALLLLLGIRPLRRRARA